MSMDQQLLEFLKENPDDPMVLMSLGSIYRREGRLQEAIEMLLRAIKADPEYMAVHAILGECYEELDDREKARQAYLMARGLARQAGDATMERDIAARLESLDNAI